MCVPDRRSHCGRPPGRWTPWLLLNFSSFLLLIEVEGGVGVPAGLAASSQRSGTPPSGRSRARRAGRGGLRGARREGGARTGCLPLPLSPRGWTKTAMPVARARPSYKARRARAATPSSWLPGLRGAPLVPCVRWPCMQLDLNCMRFCDRDDIYRRSN